MKRLSKKLDQSTELVPIERNEDIVVRGNRGLVEVQMRGKEMTVAGTKKKVDPYQLIRMIKRVTQNIGEYKTCEDVYSTIIISALRKARGDLVSLLEGGFGVHWQVDRETGESVFFVG
jgi:hypothetical protein